MALSGALALAGCGQEEVSEEKRLAGADEIVSALEVSLEENLTTNTEYGKELEALAAAYNESEGENWKIAEVGYNESDIFEYYTDSNRKEQPNYEGYGQYYVRFFDGCLIEIVYGPITLDPSNNIIWGSADEGARTVDSEAGLFFNEPTAYNKPNFWPVVGPDCVTA